MSKLLSSIIMLFLFNLLNWTNENLHKTYTTEEIFKSHVLKSHVHHVLQYSSLLVAAGGFFISYGKAFLDILSDFQHWSPSYSILHYMYVHNTNCHPYKLTSNWQLDVYDLSHTYKWYQKKEQMLTDTHWKTGTYIPGVHTLYIVLL